MGCSCINFLATSTGPVQCSAVIEVNITIVILARICQLFPSIAMVWYGTLVKKKLYICRSIHYMCDIPHLLELFQSGTGLYAGLDINVQK